MKLKDFGYALIGVVVSVFDSNLTSSELKLSREEKDLWIKDFLVRREERQKRRDREQEDFKLRGTLLTQINDAKKESQRQCNHLKGGCGVEGIITGKGDSNQYAVIKHRYRNGDTHIRCLRCSKTWMPGDENYHQALNFKTLNVTSTDVLVVSTENGLETSNFAEAFRKWTNSRPHKGLAFSLYEEKQRIEHYKKFMERLKESSKEEIKRPVTFKEELVPTVTISTSSNVLASDNPKFVNISKY